LTDLRLNTPWKVAFQNRYFVYGLVLSCLSLLVLTFFMPYFFREVIADKKGIQLDDFILDHLTPTDWSWTIFTLIYSCSLLTIVTNYKNPQVIARGLAAFSLVTWLRMLAIYVFTLEAPDGMIFLKDPFLSFIVYPQYFVKDLFFSGHVSSMVVFILMEPNKLLRWIKSMATFIVGFLILAQHVHYTLDVVAAPFFTYGIYRLVLLIQNASDKLR
jgi:hypothetical protein